ncbi:FAD-dependent oxidoreductase [Plectonema radiosum NIES-515]|uniref:FAD-dependent oxidoreductase n=1 Tax=Plectonema radiosum NIES-515 TaxID=2986073 RepID=A0ABT3B581_9CYAN|nr:FAD-dependent oxidoreductase [Plectonema radiosum]MCV3216526.1 FAD-dependent oxidoreductase [Plectonema radiosum NIES-515]
MTDVAVIGAGMAGLVCAQQLSQAGYSVLVVEKSRGLGGRVATRRLHNTCADHGVCYLKPKGELLRRFVELLSRHHILEVWTNEPDANYIAPEGMSAIALFLAQNLEIYRNQRVEAITPTADRKWRLTFESSNEELTAASVVVAIPAPQAFTLLAPLGDLVNKAFLDNLGSIEFYPSLTVMAGYPADSQPLPEWKALTFVDNPDLAWIGLDSSKRHNSQQPLFVIQSSADFAQHYLESPDLHPAAQQMLQRASESVQLSWLATPQWMQVHRWRYAFPRNPWDKAFLSAESFLPLVCCGDWCGGKLVEGAMLSGLAAAEEVNSKMRNLPLSGLNFLEFLK